MLDPEKREVPKRNWLKSIFFCISIFIFGFLALAFGKNGLDVAKQTANLASESFSELAAGGNDSPTFIKVPLKKNKTPAKKPTPSSTVKIIPTSPNNLFAVNDIPTSTQKEISSSTFPTSMPAVLSPEDKTVPVTIPNPTSSPASSSQTEKNAPTPTSQNSNLASLVIYEIQISGGPGKSEEDFIKIFNQNNVAVSIGGWKLRKRTQTGSESSIKVIPDGIVLSSGGVLVWANSKNNFSGNIGATISSTQTIASDNSIALLNSDGVVIDAVAWGSGHNNPFIEGSSYPKNPDGGQILRRKRNGTVFQDTANNALDFEV